MSLAVTSLWPVLAAAQTDTIPGWLSPHVGMNEGQIARPVLLRARALYMEKINAGIVKNPCYFAMDATRPNNLPNGKPGKRFYVICEASRSFTAIPAGHGGGRRLQGIADFKNERRCAENFSNALESSLTTGGGYITSEIITSFKGYYRSSAQNYTPFTRSFVQFDGEGETANARKREIGGHAGMLLRATCRRKDPASPYADKDGYVPVGNLVDYTGGRSNGCTTWPLADARRLMPMISGNRTTVYIYPESRDIDAVARTVAAGGSLSDNGLYWNNMCLKEIGTPKFWAKESLEPVIARYDAAHPPAVPQPLPICKAP
nr:murein L,D-transpeptidase catalytic domain family protein [Martelella alba]